MEVEPDLTTKTSIKCNAFSHNGREKSDGELSIDVPDINILSDRIHNIISTDERILQYDNMLIESLNHSANFSETGISKEFNDKHICLNTSKVGIHILSHLSDKEEGEISLESDVCDAENSSLKMREPNFGIDDSALKRSVLKHACETSTLAYNPIVPVKRTIRNIDGCNLRISRNTYPKNVYRKLNVLPTNRKGLKTKRRGSNEKEYLKYKKQSEKNSGNRLLCHKSIDCCHDRVLPQHYSFFHPKTSKEKFEPRHYCSKWPRTPDEASNYDYKRCKSVEFPFDYGVCWQSLGNEADKVLSIKTKDGPIYPNECACALNFASNLTRSSCNSERMIRRSICSDAKQQKVLNHQLRCEIFERGGSSSKHKEKFFKDSEHSLKFQCKENCLDCSKRFRRGPRMGDKVSVACNKLEMEEVQQNRSSEKASFHEYKYESSGHKSAESIKIFKETLKKREQNPAVKRPAEGNIQTSMQFSHMENRRKEHPINEENVKCRKEEKRVQCLAQRQMNGILKHLNNQIKFRRSNNLKRNKINYQRWHKMEHQEESQLPSKSCVKRPPEKKVLSSLAEMETFLDELRAKCQNTTEIDRLNDSKSSFCKNASVEELPERELEGKIQETVPRNFVEIISCEEKRSKLQDSQSKPKRNICDTETRLKDTKKSNKIKSLRTLTFRNNHHSNVKQVEDSAIADRDAYEDSRMQTKISELGVNTNESKSEANQEKNEKGTDSVFKHSRQSSLNTPLFVESARCSKKSRKQYKSFIESNDIENKSDSYSDLIFRVKGLAESSQFPTALLISKRELKLLRHKNVIFRLRRIFPPYRKSHTSPASTEKNSQKTSRDKKRNKVQIFGNGVPTSVKTRMYRNSIFKSRKMGEIFYEFSTNGKFLEGDNSTLDEMEKYRYNDTQRYEMVISKPQPEEVRFLDRLRAKRKAKLMACILDTVSSKALAAKEAKFLQSLNAEKELSNVASESKKKKEELLDIFRLEREAIANATQSMLRKPGLSQPKDLLCSSGKIVTKYDGNMNLQEKKNLQDQCRGCESRSVVLNQKKFPSKAVHAFLNAFRAKKRANTIQQKKSNVQSYNMCYESSSAKHHVV